MSYPVGPGRYRLARHWDGRIAALDQFASGTTLILTPAALRDGVHALARSGAVEVRGGRLAGVVAPARSSGHELDARPDGTVRLRKPLSPQWTFAVSRFGAVPIYGFAVLDLRDGSLLLLDHQGARALTVTRAPPGASMSEAFAGTEERDAAKPKPPPSGDPVLDFAEDFAP